jgi:hypothetical protein
MTADDYYPHVTRWARDFGWIEIGHDDYRRSMVRALDIGGLFREGKSLNGWVTDLLEQAAALPEPPVLESNIRGYQPRSAYLTVNE